MGRNFQGRITVNAIARRICSLYEAGLNFEDIQEQTGFSRDTIQFHVNRYLESDDELKELDYGQELEDWASLNPWK